MGFTVAAAVAHIAACLDMVMHAETLCLAIAAVAAFSFMSAVHVGAHTNNTNVCYVHRYNRALTTQRLAYDCCFGFRMLVNMKCKMHKRRN
jgi:hypothetical protein